MDETLRITTETALAVDVKKVAGMLGICTKTVRREIDRGEIAAVRIGKAVRIRVAEVHAYLKRKEAKGN